MRYLEWCEIKDWLVFIKRASNQKWYNALTLLEQICKFVNQSDRCSLCTEFIYEFWEIKKCYQFLWVDFPKWYILVTDLRKFKPEWLKEIADNESLSIEWMILPNI